MTLEQQLTNKELSLRMRDLGFPQESLFYWKRDTRKEYDNGFVLITKQELDTYLVKAFLLLKVYSAYTVAELGEMLPKGFYSGVSLSNDGYYCIAENSNSNYGNRKPFSTGETEADARAKMLIYLKENNLI